MKKLTLQQMMVLAWGKFLRNGEKTHAKSILLQKSPCKKQPRKRLLHNLGRNRITCIFAWESGPSKNHLSYCQNVAFVWVRGPPQIHMNLFSKIYKYALCGT